MFSQCLTKCGAARQPLPVRGVVDFSKMSTASLLNKKPFLYQPVRVSESRTAPNDYDSRMPRRRSALPMTETELRAMASAATIGLSSRPKAGYSTPAASGTPATL